MASAQSQAGGIADFLQRRVLVMLALGFSAGLPNLLIFDTLSAWLRDEVYSLAVIGFFSLATLAYSAKFLWAPLVDRTHIPVLTGWLGHRGDHGCSPRRVAIMIGLWLISGQSPAGSLERWRRSPWLVSFGATQDIVIDDGAARSPRDRRQGIMAAAINGVPHRDDRRRRGPLILAQAYSWNCHHAAMAVLMGIGVIAVMSLLNVEKKHDPAHPCRRRAEQSLWLEAGEWAVVARRAIHRGRARCWVRAADDPAPMTLIFGAEGLRAVSDLEGDTL